ncbi:MAG: hypothetical protein GY732_13290 [Gammaproteobacteria bacterium]|nr:hypothetical protein [Gammaproteobacteria bacterium]
MTSTRRISIWFTLAVSSLAAIACANVLAAGALAVNDVNLSFLSGATRIEISFNCPNRFLEYYPQEDTDFLQINLMQTMQCNSLALHSGRQDVDLPLNATKSALVSVEYESQSGDDAILQIRFSESVNAVVSQSSDQRVLNITIKPRQGFSEPEPLEKSGSKLTADKVGTGSPGAGVGMGARQMSEVQLVSLMGEGEAAFLQADYGRAIQVYTRMLQATENPYTPKALELLGLSRERNDQIAHAVTEYRRFLHHYPDHEGADRVRQRLEGLVTAHKTPRQSSSSRVAAKGRNDWDMYGGISQYYRNDTFKLEDRASINAQSSIRTNADVVLRRRGSRIDVSSRASLGHLWNLLGEDKGPESQARLYQGYVEVADKTTGLSGTLGRQTMRTSGVLGRFDGMHLAWEFKPGMRLNLMGGYPVNTTSDGIETERNFLGAAMDFEQIADIVDVTVFYNVQKIDGLTNREAIGTSARYFDKSVSFIALVDYDIGYNKLNNFVLTGNWNVKQSLTLSASIDHRTSPFLTTRNALIGQSVRTIEELLLVYSGDEIRQLAEDRSGEVSAIRLGASQSLSDRFQLNADFSMTEFKGSTASMGVPEIPDQDNQYYFSINLVGSRLFMDGDTSIFGLRYIDAGTATTSTLYLDSRFPVSKKFRINPRLRMAYRDHKMDGSTSLSLLPSLRLLYRIGRRFRLDFEGGGEWLNKKSMAPTGDRTSWFLYFGYRADF